MAVVALTTDQKDLLKQSSKFAAMIRAGAGSKSNYWINTVDPGNTATMPGGAPGANTAGYNRWRKSYGLAVMYMSNPVAAESDQSLIAFFLQNLTQNVWDNSANPAPFTVATADAVILNMEANAATMIDPAMDLAFDAKIKFTD